MRFAVEAWAPEYGAPIEGDFGVSERPAVDVTCERPISRWRPVRADACMRPASKVLFTDGVRRVDARVWIEGEEGARAGICASYAAGAVLSDGKARLVAVDVQRGLFTPAAGAAAIVCRNATYPLRAAPADTPEKLWLAVQQRMADLEVALAGAHHADLVIIDGPLSGRQNIPGAVGYVKTHHVSYLPDEVSGVLAALGPGERTPLFLTQTSWSRFSWYLRLPGGAGHPWAGVVRCEISPDRSVEDAIAVADRVAVTLPRFASRPHEDARAPQNLRPIAGLERALRRRLGDAQLLYRGLRVAASNAA